MTNDRSYASIIIIILCKELTKRDKYFNKLDDDKDCYLSELENDSKVYLQEHQEEKKMSMGELIRQEKAEKEKKKRKNIREELILFEENPVLMQVSGVMFFR